MNIIKKIFKNEVFSLSLAMMTAKLSALTRDMLFASRFGVSLSGAAYEGASGIPPAVFEVVFGCAIGSAFIPVLSQSEKAEGREASERFAGHFTAILLFVSALVSFSGVVCAPLVLSFFAKGISAYPSAPYLLSLLFPTLFLNTFSYTIVALLHFWGKFLFPALLPVFGNLFNMLYLICGFDDIFGYAFVTLFSSALELVLLMLYLKKRCHIRLKIRPYGAENEIKKVFRLTLSGFLPCALLPALSLLSISYSDTFFSGRGIAVYSYAHRIFLMAGGFFAFVFSAVLLPLFSRLEANGEKEKTKNVFFRYTLCLMAVILPITFVFAVFPDRIVSIIFMRGNFSVEDASLCASLLQSFALGLPFFAFSEIALKLYFARRHCLYPSFCALCALLIFGSLLFVGKNTKSLSYLALVHTLVYTIYSILLILGLKLFKRGAKYDKAVSFHNRHEHRRRGKSALHTDKRDRPQKN